MSDFFIGYFTEDLSKINILFVFPMLSTEAESNIWEQAAVGSLHYVTYCTLPIIAWPGDFSLSPEGRDCITI
jgi:hypothetical protein